MIYNPPILKDKINLNKKNIYLFNDNIFGGTKIRLLQKMQKNTHHIQL